MDLGYVVRQDFHAMGYQVVSNDLPISDYSKLMMSFKVSLSSFDTCYSYVFLGSMMTLMGSFGSIISDMIDVRNCPRA